MKNRNISTTTILHLKKFNDIRKIRADVFALAQRDVLAILINLELNDSQIVKEMNKLGLRTATGLPWTTKRMNHLRKRLDTLLLNELSSHARQHPVRYDFNVADILDVMYIDRLVSLLGNDSDLPESMASTNRSSPDAPSSNSAPPFNIDIDSLDPYYGSPY